jgi:hypothetical protein
MNGDDKLQPPCVICATLRREFGRLPESTKAPSDEKATAKTPLVCPLKVRNTWPAFGSHSIMVPSPLPDRTDAPSGENATEKTRLRCPRRICSKRSVVNRSSHFIFDAARSCQA